MTAALQHEWSSVRPFGADDQKTDFTHDYRVDIAGGFPAIPVNPSPAELMVSIELSDVRFS